jgi:hypothetical protein
MAESPHSADLVHLPSFITAPGESDVLMVVMDVVLLAGILMFGILFLRLHTLPESVKDLTFLLGLRSCGHEMLPIPYGHKINFIIDNSQGNDTNSF